MTNKDLENQLSQLRKKKKQIIKEFTSKTIDTINLCETTSLSQMSISMSKSSYDLLMKKEKDKKKESQ